MLELAFKGNKSYWIWIVILLGGISAAFGLYLAGLKSKPNDWCLEVKEAAEKLVATRPTAVNLKYAVDLGLGELNCAGSREGMIDRLFHLAMGLAETEVKRSQKIGDHGLALIRECYEKKQAPVNILTHCNAGWLATVDWGTALSPIYRAHDAGIPVHVWVDETRPRNQGARLTAWELGQHGIDHTVIVDNVGGHLMQHGRVDICITGTDRTTRAGDVANKIGTYLKALAAHDNGIPFYVALPSTTIDWTIANGLNDIPIEERSTDEVTHVAGLDGDEVRAVQTVSAESPAKNYAFDVTPARLLTGLITERGICEASETGLVSLYPERQEP